MNDYIELKLLMHLISLLTLHLLSYLTLADVYFQN